MALLKSWSSKLHSTQNSARYLELPLVSDNRELKHARFWDADGNRKRKFRVLGPCLARAWPVLSPRGGP